MTIYLFSEMFYFAQKAVLHPSAPLWNYQETLKIFNYNKIYLELIFLFLLFFIWASLNLFYLLLRDIFTGFVQEKDLTDSCKKALGLIFKICDMDNDGIMCDAGITLLYYIYICIYHNKSSPIILQSQFFLLNGHTAEDIIREIKQKAQLP